MTGKRKPDARRNALDRAYAVLKARYGSVERLRDCLWMAKECYIRRLPRKAELLVRFDADADGAWVKNVLGTLAAAGVPHHVARPYRLDRKSGPVVVDQADDDVRWIGRTGRDPHVRSCLLCRDLLEQCALGSDEYVEEARRVVEAHVGAGAPSVPGLPKCSYAGCVLHEQVPRALAASLIRVGDGDVPWRDIRGVSVSMVPFTATAKDHPEGWDPRRSQRDAANRSFRHLKPAAAHLYVRLAPKRVTVHLWVDPPFASREEVDDAASVLEVVETHERRVPAMVEWAKRKYRELMELAQMDAEFDGKEG